MNTRRFLIGMTVVGALLLVSAGAGADSLTPFQKPFKPVGLKHFTPNYHNPENKDNMYYTEQWAFSFYLAKNYGGTLQLGITNLGSSGKAAAKCNFEVPGGKDYKYKKEVTGLGKDWNYAKDKVDITIAGAHLTGSPGRLTATCKNDEFEVTWDIKNREKPWRPGTGRVYYGSGKTTYYDFTLLAPKAAVKGSFKDLKTGETHEVKGYAYIDHSYFNVPPQHHTKRVVSFRSLRRDHVVIFSMYQVPEAYGDSWHGWIYASKDGKVVMESVDLKMKVEEMKPDTKTSYGYQFPVALKLMAEEGDLKLMGEIKAKELTSQDDYLKSMSKVVRFIVEKFVQPVAYYFNALYKFTIVTPAGPIEIKGQGRLSYKQFMK